MSGQSVFHLHHANCKDTKFSCDFQIFRKEFPKKLFSFPKCNEVGVEVGVRYLLGRCSANTYLRGIPLYVGVLSMLM